MRSADCCAVAGRNDNSNWQVVSRQKVGEMAVAVGAVEFLQMGWSSLLIGVERETDARSDTLAGQSDWDPALGECLAPTAN